MLKKLRREMDRSDYVRRSSGEPCAHSLNSDLHAARFSTEVPVIIAGEVRQSKRRRRAAVDGEDFVSGIPRGRRMRRSPRMVQINAALRLPQMWRMPLLTVFLFATTPLKAAQP